MDFILSLTLCVFGRDTDNANTAFAAHDFTFYANFSYGCSHFHKY